MSDQVEIPFGDHPSDTATLLLAAAEDLGLPGNVVQTSGQGHFTVPKEVADQAGYGDKPKGDDKPKTTKKTAAKKSSK